MKTNTILDQMGIQQWCLREPLRNSLEGGNAAERVLARGLEETINENTKELDPILVDEQNTAIEPTDNVSQVIEQSPQKSERKSQAHDWPALIELVNDTQYCRSCSQVTPILGDGNITAEWMFVFDSPTARDIEQQELLTGRVGQLFDAILFALSLDRATVYLSSIFKCPPAANITEDTAQCDGLLQHQIRLVQPKVVITFGEFAARALIKANESLEQLREQHRQCFDQPIAVIPTYSLMQMLDTPQLKAKVWDDLKNATKLIET